MPSTYFVYILRCHDSSLYTGISNDLKNRLKKHNLGKASKYTRSRLPVELVYQKEALDKSSALKCEIALKKLSKIDKERLVKGAS